MGRVQFRLAANDMAAHWGRWILSGPPPLARIWPGSPNLFRWNCSSSDSTFLLVRGIVEVVLPVQLFH